MRGGAKKLQKYLKLLMRPANIIKKLKKPLSGFIEKQVSFIKTNHNKIIKSIRFEIKNFFC
jgi:hypothetical protein